MDKSYVSVSNKFSALRAEDVAQPKKPRRRKKASNATASRTSDVPEAASEAASTTAGLAEENSTTCREEAIDAVGPGWQMVGHKPEAHTQQQLSEELLQVLDASVVEGEDAQQHAVEAVLDLQSSSDADPAALSNAAVPTESQTTSQDQDGPEKDLEALINDLESAITKWDISSPEGLHQLLIWSQMLSLSVDPTADTTFFYAFTRSNVLDRIVESVLQSKEELDIETRQVVLDIFSLSLLGSAADHQWLHRTLRTVASIADNCSRKPQLLQLVRSIVDGMKSKYPKIQSSGDKNAQDQHDQDWKGLKVETSEGRETPQSMERRCLVLEAALGTFLGKNGLISIDECAIDNTVLDDWKLSFYIIQTEISNIQSIMEEQASDLIRHKRECDQQLEDTLRPERENLQSLTHELSSLEEKEALLLYRQEELRRALADAETSLVEVERQKRRVSDDIQQLSQVVEHADEEVLLQSKQTEEKLSSIQQDISSVQFVQAFARGVNHRILKILTPNSHRTSFNLGEMLECMQQYVWAQHLRSEFLENRIQYCRRRMLAVAEERRQFDALGITRTAVNGLDEQLRVAILNDEKERVAIEAAVNQRLADVASIINASNVDQFETFAQQMQAPEIRSRFDMSMFTSTNKVFAGRLLPFDTTDEGALTSVQSCTWGGDAGSQSRGGSATSPGATSSLPSESGSHPQTKPQGQNMQTQREESNASACASSTTSNRRTLKPPMRRRRNPNAPNPFA